MREIEHLTTVFDDQTSLRAKGFAGHFANRNFTAVFDDQTSFRAKGLRLDALQIAILPQFLTIKPHFVRKGCAWTLCKSQFYRCFWRSNLISCERVAPGRFANRNFTAVLGDRTSFRAKRLRREAGNRNFTQFLAIEPRFVRKGCVSRRLVGTAPRLQERNRKERESKRAREQGGKRECEDVRM